MEWNQYNFKIGAWIIVHTKSGAMLNNSTIYEVWSDHLILRQDKGLVTHTDRDMRYYYLPFDNINYLEDCVMSPDDNRSAPDTLTRKNPPDMQLPL